MDGEAAPRTENFDTVVFATGRVSNLEPLGLDKAGVYALRNKIVVDERDATSNPRIFAIGDVAAGVKSHARSPQTRRCSPSTGPSSRPSPSRLDGCWRGDCEGSVSGSARQWDRRDQSAAALQPASRSVHGGRISCGGRSRARGRTPAQAQV